MAILRGCHVCDLAGTEPDPFSDSVEASIEHDNSPASSMSAWKNLLDVAIDIVEEERGGLVIGLYGNHC